MLFPASFTGLDGRNGKPRFSDEALGASLFNFRLFVPCLFFALIHLADEQFDFERFAVLLAAGIVQGLAYLLTGNIWFASGLHAGANIASFSITGLWHAGAIVSVAGQSTISNSVMVLILLVLLSLAFVLKQRFYELRS